MWWDQAPEAKPPAEKAPKKPAVKATVKKVKTAEVVKEEAVDPVAEKLRQQRFEYFIMLVMDAFFSLVVN